MSKVALIVGGGRSLGEYLSKHMATEGYTVAVADLVYENARKVADEIRARGGQGMAVGVNACIEAEVEAMIQTVVGEWGPDRSLDLQRRTCQKRQDHGLPLKNLSLLGRRQCKRLFPLRQGSCEGDDRPKYSGFHHCH